MNICSGNSTRRRKRADDGDGTHDETMRAGQEFVMASWDGHMCMYYYHCMQKCMRASLHEGIIAAFV